LTDAGVDDLSKDWRTHLALLMGIKKLTLELGVNEVRIS
jgi:hypothetical protein